MSNLTSVSFWVSLACHQERDYKKRLVSFLQKTQNLGQPDEREERGFAGGRIIALLSTNQSTLARWKKRRKSLLSAFLKRVRDVSKLGVLQQTTSISSEIFLEKVHFPLFLSFVSYKTNIEMTIEIQDVEKFDSSSLKSNGTVEDDQTNLREAPDGGISWIVLIGCFCVRTKLYLSCQNLLTHTTFFSVFLGSLCHSGIWLFLGCLS